MPSTLWGINTMYLIAGAAIVLLLIIIIASSSGKKRRQAEEEAASAASTPIAYIAPETASVSEPVSGISAKTVAAIMAAVSAASGTPVQQLRFTAIRRVTGIQGPWASSGTAEIIATRQTYL